jgi:hypothetical protein
MNDAFPWNVANLEVMNGALRMEWLLQQIRQLAVGFCTVTDLFE